MKTLGINSGHDASAAVIGEDGRVLVAHAEERFNRIKVFTGWPSKALATIEPGNYHVAIAGRESSWSDMEKRYCQFMFNDGMEYHDIFNERNWSMSFGSRRHIDARPMVIERLAKQGIVADAISYFDHHQCHAASAYYTSGFGDALVITTDGSGDGRSATAHTVIDGVWKEVSSTSLPHSPGHMYSWATQLLGYKISRHEGKITGLAAFGSIRNVDLLLDKLLTYDKDSDSFVSPFCLGKMRPRLVDKLRCALHNKPLHVTYEYFRRLVIETLGDQFQPEDIAALAQVELEKSVVAWVEALVDRTGLRNIALAGGVFANVKLNQRISAIHKIDQLWIFPDMGDGGLSVGAAYLNIKNRSPIHSLHLDDVYLGPQYSEDEIVKACIAANLQPRKSRDLGQEVAKFLSDNLIVGWFQGRMEYGPRALGHRSILLHPGRREMNQVVNKRLNRTEFMPFAPSVLSEYADQLFINRQKSTHADQFMTITYDVKPEWIDKLGAVVHVDNTARPQVVHFSKEPLYWTVINEFRKITGLPAIVNTSFNMHEEPIVCSPTDAIRSYLHGAVDVLVLGDLIIQK